MDQFLTFKTNQKFHIGNVVDVRIPGKQLGDWEQGIVVHVKGSTYTVETFSGTSIVASEDQLFAADA
jgi:hypothetical protein